ncbi:MAG: efflux RND transporter periplasmic adaptor subunit [Spirochaetota bacterium]|nr:efflux RND transporter periplasmic adaptor subunit [Spirochaetota bacterium]
MKALNVRHLLVIIPVTLLIALIAYRFYDKASNKNNIKTQHKKQSKEIILIQPLIKSYSEDFVSYGNLEAVAKVDIHTKVESRIISLYKDVSSSVSRGSLLVQLDDKELMERINQKQAMANVVRASARQDAILARHKKLIYQRALKAFRDNIIPEQELDDSKTTYEVSLAQATLSRARVREAEAAIKEVETRLKETRIYSPIEGIVSERFLDEGSLVRPGQPIFSIITIKVLKILVNLPEKDIHHILNNKGKLRDDIRVIVRVDALKKTFPGILYRIYPTIDTSTRTAKVEIRLDNDNRILKPGLYCQVAFNIITDSKALFLKKKAVHYDEIHKKYYVQQEDKGIVKITEVKVSRDDEKDIMIISGLTESDRVVYPYNSYLSDGSKIPVREKKSLP